ncbi:unnamed protein product [Camellia sinensis]
MRWKPTIYAGGHSRYFVVLFGLGQPDMLESAFAMTLAGFDLGTVHLQRQGGEVRQAASSGGWPGDPT